MNPIIKQSQTTGEYEINGATALGLMENIEYSDIEFQLKKETSLIMYTDGISEAHDSNNDQYTDERLIQFISDIKSNNAENICNKIFENVAHFSENTEQFDDITLLIIHYE